MDSSEIGVWHTCADGNYPPVNVQVIGGCWYHDAWLVDSWVWLQGMCTMIESNHRDFVNCGGKQWRTFGPSHNMITHWCYSFEPPPHP